MGEYIVVEEFAKITTEFNSGKWYSQFKGSDK